jgi:predicted transcriptional regulator
MTANNEPLQPGAPVAVDPVAVLRALVVEYGSQTAVGAVLGVSPSFVSDLLLGRRTFSKRLLARMGLKPVIVRR